MVQKRGQITIFLVVGIILLVVTSVIFFTASYMQTGTLIGEKETPLSLKYRQPIKTFVESCIEETSIPGIFLLGMQGGVLYPENPEKVLATEFAVINFGYLNGVNQLSTSEMEKEINKYVEESLPSCLGGFFPFAAEGILVQPLSDINSDTKIKMGEIIISVDYNLKVHSGDDIMRIDTFLAHVPIRMGEVVSYADGIIENHEESPGEIDFSYLTSFDAFISLFPFDDITTIYSLSDEKSIVNDAPFTFMFAIRDENVNTAPRLDFVSDVVVRKGELFTQEFFAEDDEYDELSFSSNSEMFPISSDGLLNVTANQIGEYAVTVTVEDEWGLTDEYTFTVIVEE